ncbi:MAG TPA: sigma-54 dependent transcriptional regulator, partial [Polyangiaceae bacterium]|nr:sigma-54 dependent transcriptional regulator [Polyangiaceae bacterium]
MTPSVLLVDDDNELTRVLAEWLRQRGYRIEIASRAEPALDALERCAFDVVVTDLRMPGVSGIELCGRVAERCPGLPVIVMTGFGSLDAAIDAIRAGAYDFVEKPVKLDLLRIAIDRAATHAAARREIRRLREAGTGHAVVPGLVGESEAIRRVAAAIDGIAAADTTVLVAGETGTGKEVVAQAIHAASRRATRPFVALNCAAIPESLLESELFGHARGAFTDARAARGGLFERASGGTLFLDEIGDMPPSTQPKLLRVLQEKQYRPVGSDVEHRVDVRVIAATNIDI